MILGALLDGGRLVAAGGAAIVRPWRALGIGTRRAAATVLAAGLALGRAAALWPGAIRQRSERAAA